MKCPVMSFEMSMDLVWLWAACILKLRAMFLCCWRICVVCLSLELVGPRVVLGFSVGMEAFDEFYWLMFPEFRSSQVFSRFGLKPPASGFQSYSYSSLKTSPSPFEDNGLPFWVPDVLCQHSEVVLWNLLSIQMILRWICWGESGPIPLPSKDLHPCLVKDFFKNSAML